ncbi:General stress protein 26 [Oryzisolibacter propanilivorax]|uniref:General stress protein 26 n=1 Tax=Oryzisolibacter propanilivorax TaxID=1527607 RepID=A0A1G9TFQ3_9BURK|nr:pyridoxamine 5'-phosphate oxidase family protein [Oryzisolibacter propanilivorax]SDM46510.1 General stress protein 26 [Oryzisolibacter propanilivorax]
MQRSQEFKNVAQAMGKIDFCMMQTVGEQGVRTRPMSNNGEVEYDGDNWFFTSADTVKVREIQQDARVQLVFVDSQAVNFIAVWGRGEVVEDAGLKKKLWREELKEWFPEGPEDKDVLLIKVSATRIQSWGQMGEHVLHLDA